MAIIEDNSKKVAAVLCVASCFPVVATVYAMETEPGWHGDKYVNEDATVAKGWQEIEGKSYYFSEEDGKVEKKSTNQASVASVTANISGDVQKAVEEGMTVAVNEIEQEKAQAIEDALALGASSETVVVDTPVTGAEVVYETPVYIEPVVEEVVEEQPVVEEPVVEDVVDEPTIEDPVVDEPVVEEVVEEQPVVEEQVVEQPVVQEQAVETSSNPYASLNASIASAAQTLVGVTDGQWCTQVVQQSLALAGVSDAYQLWPDQYAPTYGYYTSDPQAGNLIYYYNGGRGVDHIAVYIGDGLAVHGNYDGKTVVASAVIDGGAPQYIQVCR